MFGSMTRHPDSERGTAAKRAAGRRFGRLHSITGYPARMECVRALDAKGLLRDEQDELRVSARMLADLLNTVESRAQIKNPATIRRWKNAGFPGLAKEKT